MKPEISLWRPSPDRLPLSNKELHLWRFKLDVTEAGSKYFRHNLVAEEITRADRLLDRQKKHQFIAAKAQTRLILGKYLRIKPNQVQFQYTRHSKPYLSKLHQSLLTFNLSHSGDWGLLAVVKEMAVGADIEYIDPEINFPQLSKGYFNEQEMLDLAQYQQSRRRRGFYRLWTQKEAMLKLLGSGFGVSPTRNVVPDAFIWQFKTFPISTDYLGTVAFEKKIEQVKKFHFSVT